MFIVCLYVLFFCYTYNQNIPREKNLPPRDDDSGWFADDVPATLPHHLGNHPRLLHRTCLVFVGLFSVFLGVILEVSWFFFPGGFAERHSIFSVLFVICLASTGPCSFLDRGAIFFIDWDPGYSSRVLCVCFLPAGSRFLFFLVGLLLFCSRVFSLQALLDMNRMVCYRDPPREKRFKNIVVVFACGFACMVFFC